jgi:lipopolysaccharide export system permease protein
MFTSPRVCYELIPSAALIGSLFVVGAMANNREIVAMRAAGLSTFWVIRAIMAAGLVLVIAAVFIGEFISPGSERTAQLIKATSKNDEVVMRTQYGMWFREGNQFINVRRILDDGSLADVRIYELNDQHKLTLMTRAESAQFTGNQHWQLKDIQQSELTAKQIFAHQKAAMNWQSAINPDLLKVVVVNSDNLSLYDLFQYIHFLKSNNQKSQTYELAFWSRLINPLVTFVMLMVSAPFAIGIHRGMSTGGRLMIGVVIGMSFNILDSIVGHIGLVYNLNPMLMAVLPSTVVFCGALLAVSRR